MSKIIPNLITLSLVSICLVQLGAAKEPESSCPEKVVGYGTHTQVRFDGVAMEALASSYEDFRRNSDLTARQLNIACYDVTVKLEGVRVIVTFGPKLPSEPNVYLFGGSAPWGKGVVYTYDVPTKKIITKRYEL